MSLNSEIIGDIHDDAASESASVNASVSLALTIHPGFLRSAHGAGSARS